VQRVLLMISLPIAFVVSSIYWTLLLVAPSLILPPLPTAEPSSSSAVPELARLSLDHDLALHASPVLALLLEFIFFQEKYSVREVNYGATFLAILAGAAYGSWVEYCASYNKTFPYPFLTENPFNIRIGIYAVATLLALLSFRGINFAHSRGKKATKQA